MKKTPPHPKTPLKRKKIKNNQNHLTQIKPTQRYLIIMKIRATKVKNFKEAKRNARRKAKALVDKNKGIPTSVMLKRIKSKSS